MSRKGQRWMKSEWELLELGDGYMLIRILVPHFCECSFSIVKI